MAEVVDTILVDDSVVRQETQAPNGGSVSSPQERFEVLSSFSSYRRKQELSEGRGNLTVPAHTTLSGNKRWEDGLPANRFLDHQVVERYNLLGERGVGPVRTCTIGGLDDVGESEVGNNRLMDDALDEAAAVVCDGLRTGDGGGNVRQCQLTRVGVVGHRNVEVVLLTFYRIHENWEITLKARSTPVRLGSISLLNSALGRTRSGCAAG